MSNNISVPPIRIVAANDHEIRNSGDFVLYWMIAQRRLNWNFALQRAVEYAEQLGKPLVILEALRCGYRWASERLHHFIVQGMADNQRRADASGVFYYAYLEDEPRAGSGLLESLSRQAAVVVTDEFPCFFLPQMVAAAADRVGCRMELIDGNGLLPLRAADRVFPLAHSFRRFLQKTLPEHLAHVPQAAPLTRLAGHAPANLPADLQRKWPPMSPTTLVRDTSYLQRLPIDHQVLPSSITGGSRAGEVRLSEFIAGGLDDYGERRNHPDDDKASGLSPYLHFGHISVHQVFHDVMSHDGWTPGDQATKATGSREGWWNASPSVESFLDELITWRELGYNMSWQRADYDQYQSLPDWALQTLQRHARDPRPYVYDLSQFEAAETHDEIWNAAQRQLVREGRVHNYLRMLWGKKILHWSHSPQEALAIMIELNNKYALDGRNPNSYSGIFW
ncbi:MAG: deoxyribodipyrimidine photolyase, partial [Planctomycetales bacterium]|nr:deoxyribodipyrimidine photolyase [Planctomycetales bacterium]